MMDKVAELKADAKSVYGEGNLVVLAEKYGVTTARIAYCQANPDHSGPVLATSSDHKEVQSKLYATIKGQLRELGAN